MTEPESSKSLGTMRWFSRVHLATSAFLVLFSSLALGGLVFLSFDDDLENLFSGDTQEFRDFKRHNELFGSQDDNCVILLGTSDVLSIDSLKAIRQTDSALHELEKLKDIQSVCHLLDSQKIGRLLLPVVPYEGALEKAWTTAAEKLKKHPLGQPFIAFPKLNHTLISFRFQDDTSDRERDASLAKVDEILNEHWLNRDDSLNGEQNDRNYGLTGLPVLRDEVTKNLQRDQAKFTWLGLLFALIVGWFLFRRPVPVLFVAAVPFIGLGCIMGLLGWFGVSLNIVNNVITPLVLVIGFAEVIHILFLTGGLIAKGMNRGEAVVCAVRQLFVPCLLAALTTAIGFGSLYLSTDKSLREFAIVSSLASMIMFLMVLSLSGCLLATPLGKYCIRKPSATQQHSQKKSSPMGKWMPVLVSLFAVVSLYVCALIASNNHTDYRFTENLPQNNSAVKTLHEIDDAFGGSSNDQVMIEFEKKPSPQSLIATLETVRQRLEAVPSVGRTVSFLDLLRSLPPDEGSMMDRFRELRNLPQEFWNHFLKLNPTIARIQMKLPDLGSDQLYPILNRIDGELQKAETKGNGISATMTGLNVLSVKRSQRMIGDLTRSLVGASVAIFVLILAVYRSIMFAIASIIVNGLPILGVAAVMSLMEQPIQYTGIMLLCVCLGLAVDDTVHFLSKQKWLERQGIPFEESVLGAVKSLWPVFVTTSVMLGVGFGLAATSAIPTFKIFGGFACVALLFALLADLLILPCLLIQLNRIKSWIVRKR